MEEKQIKKIVKYWEETAADDFITMKSLFKSKRYHFSLFVGHLVLEKILKAHVVFDTKKDAPFTHNLSNLQERTTLNLPEETLDLINKISDFNIRGRYPDYKQAFYKKCTQEFTKEYLEKITILYRKLCQKLKQKK